VGNTINQRTSGERWVNTDGRPPQIRPKIRTRAALIKPLVISTMPISKPGA